MLEFYIVIVKMKKFRISLNKYMNLKNLIILILIVWYIIIFERFFCCL